MTGKTALRCAALSLLDHQKHGNAADVPENWGLIRVLSGREAAKEEVAEDPIGTKER